MKRISIIIPAHNEAGRIGKTLDAYSRFLGQQCGQLIADYELVVVLNGCIDDTKSVVEQASSTHGHMVVLDLAQAGKGLAVAAGFRDALTRPNDIIGFVDADMATQPEHFADLIRLLHTDDGIIASRYMAGSQVYPPRPFIKTWGRKVVYHSLVRVLFGMSYYDYQCGAKLFTRQTIEKLVPHLHVRQWAFDVELLYLCKKFGCSIKEIPTTWHDQADSKLRVMRSGMRMITSLFEIRKKHLSS